MSGDHTHNTPEVEDKPKTSINRKEAFHNAMRGVEIGITAGTVLGAAIAVGISATMLPTIALVTSFAIIGAAVAVEGNPFVFFKECCTKGVKSLKNMVVKHGHHHEHGELPAQTELQAPVQKRVVTFESQENELPSVNFQKKLMEQSRTQAQGKGI